MFDNFFKKVLPEEPKELDNLTPMNELLLDFKALGKWIFIFFAVAIFVSTFISGFIYQLFRNIFTGDTIFIFSSFKYGITKMILLTIVFVILIMAFGYKIYRSVKRNYIMNYKDNYMKSKRETFGGAHFQDEKELKENFHIFSSVDETDENIFGTDADNKIYTHITKPGMNMNEAFFGAPGSGKTSAKILSDCMQCLKRGDSMILTDTKGDVYSQTSAIARKMGYKVRVLNLKISEFKNSDAFNLLECLKPNDPTIDAKADMIANIIVKNTSSSEREVNDYWAKNELNLFKAVALYVATDPTLISLGRNTLPEMFNVLSSNNAKDLAAIFTRYPKDTPIRQAYDIFSNCEDRNQGQIINGAAIRLSKISNQYLQQVLSHNEIDPVEPMKKKCIYYVIISDTDDTYRVISSLFFSMLFNEQCDYSDKLTKEEKKAQKSVYYLLDEYRATGGIYGLPVKIATVRSRKIGLTMILQDKGQLDSMYDETEAGTILNCCTVKGLLSTNDLVTATYFSDLMGKQTVVTESERVTESTADTIHAHGEVQKTHTENERHLMKPEELMNGKLSRDEIVYIISAEPPVKLKKYFSELGGEAIHPLLKQSYELGEKKPHKHKPQWRKKIEEAEKEKEDRLKKAQAAVEEKIQKEDEELDKKEAEKKTEKSKKEDSVKDAPKSDVREELSSNFDSMINDLSSSTENVKEEKSVSNTISEEKNKKKPKQYSVTRISESESGSSSAAPLPSSEEKKKSTPAFGEGWDADDMS